MARSDAPTPRIPPHDLSAESAILGALLFEGRDATPRVVEALQPEDFYTEAHRAVATAVYALFGRGEAVDALTVSAEMARAGTLEPAGGPAKLALLMEEASIATNLMSYVALVRDAAMLRELITASAQALRAAYDAKGPAQAIVDTAEQALFRLAERRMTGHAQSIGALLPPTFERLEDLYARKEHITGVASGLDDLDLQTSGFQPGDFVLIAGRPSMGKTAMVLSIARHATTVLKKRVLVLSLEMSAGQLTQRLLCAEARVDAQSVRTGHLSSSEWHKLIQAANRLAELPLFIDDSPALTVLEARAKARRHAAEHGLDLLVIDYLQLMRGTGAENRQQEISEISRSLKSLAKELNVPVVALSQLSRAVEQRKGDHRPILSDLRESGSLEQDADLILFIYRPAVYADPDEPGIDVSAAEIIIGKQRNGPVGTVECIFLPHYGRFDNRSEREP